MNTQLTIHEANQILETHIYSSVRSCESRDADTCALIASAYFRRSTRAFIDGNLEQGEHDFSMGQKWIKCALTAARL